MKVVKQSVQLLWITDQPEQQIELAGRTCYKSEDRITDESAGKFVRQLCERGHHAMIEHAVASFRIITDRGISHEIVRHRIASYAQESTRYCNYNSNKFDKQCTFIEPPNLTSTQKEIWRKICLLDEQNYFQLLESGCSPQIARSVLPTCLKTEIVMTANLREWRHFISLRSAKTAHPQIKSISDNICDTLLMYAPNIFSDLI